MVQLLHLLLMLLLLLLLLQLWRQLRRLSLLLLQLPHMLLLLLLELPLLERRRLLRRPRRLSLLLLQLPQMLLLLPSIRSICCFRRRNRRFVPLFCPARTTDAAPIPRSVRVTQDAHRTIEVRHVRDQRPPPLPRCCCRCGSLLPLLLHLVYGMLCRS